MKKICRGGGAEKQILLQASNLAQSGLNVGVACQSYDKQLLTELSPKVDISVGILKSLIKSKGAYVISFLATDHTFCVPLAAIGWIKWIPFERIHPAFYYSRFTRSGHVSRFIKRNLLRLSYQTLTKHILVQTKDAEKYWNKLGVTAKTLPNIVNLKTAPTILAENPNNFKILMVGRLCPQKNYELAITVFDHLNKKYPGKFALDICGNGPSLLHLEKRIFDLGLSDKIIMHGYTNPDKFLKKADLFLMTSHVEGMPNALTEAMANGLPCLVGNFPGGVRDLFLEKEASHQQVAKAPAPAAFIHLIEKLYTNRSLRADLGKRNYKLIQNNYTPEKYAENAKAIFSEIMSY
tara:strand:- start:214 stop:1263 length:1050 start_codon:yes stop_codon:yes gene_type:complete